MNNDLVSVNFKEEINSRGVVKYHAEITHKGLKEYKLLSSTDEDILENKIASHLDKLDERWNKIVEKSNIVKSKEERVRHAQLQTKEAIEALEGINNLLHQTLSIDDAINWESLKDKTKFKIPPP